MTNNEEKVHVRAYVKDDGTKVKEHYRGLPDGMSDEDHQSANMRLNGGVEKNIYLGRKDLKVDEIYMNEMKKLKNARENVEETAQKSEKTSEELLNAIQQAQLNGNWSRVDKALENLKTAHQQQHAQQKELLVKLTETNVQREYKKLYDIYVEQHARLIEKDRNMRSIEFALEKGYIEEAVEVLQEYNQTYKEVYQKYKALTAEIRTLWSDSPKAQKELIGFGMFLANIFAQASDAKELWKIATSYNMEICRNYINKNGRTVSSISDLPENIQDRVKKKVQTQFNQKDALGIVFHPNSSLAVSVEQHESFQKCLKTNLKQLLKNEKINTSLRFSGTFNNAALALGKADVLNMYMDSEGNIHAQIFDTYEFNEDDPNWMVALARNSQEHHFLRSFYTITEISIPVPRWINYVDISDFK